VPPRRLTRAIAGALAVAALAAPAASARPIPDDSPPAARSFEPDATVIRRGFDWGSAGIGAAAGAGLVLVGAGSFALTHRGRLRLAR
jgi:hypothetical protein